MPKNRPATWLLVSVVWWHGFALAEPPEVEPNPPTAAEASAEEEQDGMEPGVVIEEIPKGSTLEKAGLQVGDVITAWKRLPNPPANPEAAEGMMASYFDWQELEVEQAPRGTVVLRGRRGSEPLELTVTPGVWEVEVRPVLPAELEAIYTAGKVHLAAGVSEGAVRDWGELVKRVRAESAGVLRAWVALRIGEAWGDKGEWRRAIEAYLEVVAAIDSPQVQIATWQALGKAHESRNDYDAAEAAYNSVLGIRQKVHPDSLGIASSLNSLGEIAWARGDLESASKYFFRAMKIQDQFAPQSIEVAQSLNNLGAVAQARGELSRASDYSGRALQIREKLAPRSLLVAASLNNLGFGAQVQGDLDSAQDYYLRALQLKEQLAPQSLTVAASLNNLGFVALARGELGRARGYLLQALQIREQRAPQSLAVAESLSNLGAQAQARGALDEADNYYSNALQIREQLAPQSRDVAYSLSNLGSVAQARGRLDLAQKSFVRALQILKENTPGSLEVAVLLSNLGVVAMERGELGRAQSYQSEALQIREQLTPVSFDVAISLNKLGSVAQARGELSRARSYFSEAIVVLEHQLSRLGGSYNVQAGFRAQYRGYYLDLLDLLFTQNRFSEAFQVLERFRAQTFLTMLAERDVAFTADIPADLDSERRRIGVLSDRTLKTLAGLNSRDHAELIEATRRELQKLDDEAGDVEARIRSASPKLAALQYPQPLDSATAQQALDPGTLLLSFSVGKEKTALFTLSRSEGLEVKTLPLGEEALRTRVKQLLSLLQESGQGSSVGELRKHRIEAAGRELLNALLGPVAGKIAASERLLILPDGPLHVLPFGALVRDTKDGPQYLAAWKPLHVALSATVYAELKQRRNPAADQHAHPAPLQLAAFGDPIYPQSLVALKSAPPDVRPAEGGIGGGRGDPTVRGAAERGLFDFQPLPYTRREVLGIASLFPEGTARTFLGPEALEEQIKSLDPKTRILHLAAHGSTDEHLPSGSFIALTIPEETATEDTGPQRDNGLLQVWEIFERVRLRADLVVLSACDTGLGEEQGGEGLIGLTRAFQYAGARSVLASLWNVQDQATSELMIRFYKHLLAGLPKDQALQAAQQELIAGPIEVVNEKGEREVRDFSAPYYWAGFQLYGDWQ